MLYPDLFKAFQTVRWRLDSDFCAFMSIWFYEEQKHAAVLMEYLRRFRPELVPTEQELADVRFEFDPAPPLETLMLHFCGEIRLNHWYRRAAEWHAEPVIRKIYELISGDEARRAFAKIGVLMASARRAGKPLHPTNLHVNRDMYPRDTVQSRMPDPAWLPHWLDEQIQFNSRRESRVVKMILTNLSLLLGERFESVQDLNRFRKALAPA
jgi:hypothetical protein